MYEIVRKFEDASGSLLTTVAKGCINLQLHEGCPEGVSAVYTLIQCTPLLVEKLGVALNVTFRFITCKQVSVQARGPPWL